MRCLFAFPLCALLGLAAGCDDDDYNADSAVTRDLSAAAPVDAGGDAATSVVDGGLD